MDDFTIDENKIESLITNKTSAISPVHVFGVEIEGKGIGDFGDISMFSLHTTKIYNSIEGGLLATKNETLKNKFKLLKNYGILGVEGVEIVGINAKVNEFQASMGVVNLRYLHEQIKNRKIVVDTYRDKLKKFDGISYLDDTKNIIHNYLYFPIIINEEVTE